MKFHDKVFMKLTIKFLKFAKRRETVWKICQRKIFENLSGGKSVKALKGGGRCLEFLHGFCRLPAW